MILAACGMTGGIVASVIVNSLAKRREAKIWKEVEINRQKLNRIQTLRRWKRYSKAFENHHEDKLLEVPL